MIIQNNLTLKPKSYLSGETSLFSKKIISPKNTDMGDLTEMQTSIIMNRQSFRQNMKKLIMIAAIVLTSIGITRAQDTITVKGTILNGSNKPIANVSVGVEGSFELPSVTDSLGKFQVLSITGKEWLNIEPTTLYKNKRVFLNNRAELTVYLTEKSIDSGDDMVNVLAQEYLKRNLVSSFATLDADNIKQTPVLTIDQYMQGRVSGMHIINRSGDPGSGAVSMLRGINSLNATTAPLYIVDGIPITPVGIFGSNLAGFSYNPLLGINNLDISKTTVIKDPGITAAYGSKASNGLVLIETLDPSATQTIIEIDLRSGYSLAPANQIPQMNAGQHKTLVSELLVSSGLEEEFIREDYPNLFLNPADDRFKDYQHNTNWQDLIYSNAAFTNLNINVKGGDEIARYGLSFGYVDGDGIIKTTGYQGYNLRFVGLLNIFTWLKMNAGVSLSYNNAQLKESAKVLETSPILTSLAKSPMLNPYQYDEEGQQLTALANVDELGISNPQAVIDNYEAKNNNFNFTSTLGFEVTFTDNLFLNTNFGLTYNVLKEQLFMPNRGMELYYNDEAINVSKATNNSLNTFYNNTYLGYSKTFGDHKITSSTGVNILNNEFEYDWGLTKNAHENDEYRMLQDGQNNLREIGGANRVWNWLSFYEYLNYSYNDKYFASLTLSLDGSSRVGDNAVNTLKIADVPFGVFYSTGAAWRISNESFLKNKAWLEELKLRVSYGKSGNDDIGESNATNYYNAIKFRETSGLYPGVLANDELTYETVSQINAGVDLALLGNRFIASVDVYNSVTDNMLIYAPLEAYFGYEFRPENNGQMKNKGIDIDVFYRLIDRPAFKWDTRISYSKVANEITEIRGDKLITPVRGAEIVNMVGEQANSFYGYIFDGVYTTNEDAISAGLLNDKLVAYQGGDAIFKDISGPNGTPDGIINNFDKTVIGSALPDFFGGLSNTFTYKRFSLNVFLQAVSGNEIFNYLRFQNESMSGLANQSTRVLNRWQYDGQQTDVPRAVWDDLVGNSSFSTRWIEDGSYLRVKNISLSYTIPSEFWSIRNAQFYVSASNVFTVSKYLGYDPEFAHSHSNIEQGIDYGLTPQPRQFIVGVKLGL